MGTFVLASVGFVVLVIIVAIAFAAGQRRGIRRPVDEPTGYTPGVWLLGAADSANPGDHHHGSSHGHASHGGHSDGGGAVSHGAGAASGDGGGANRIRS